jgi:hypothetical protein
MGECNFQGREGSSYFPIPNSPNDSNESHVANYIDSCAQQTAIGNGGTATSGTDVVAARITAR